MQKSSTIAVLGAGSWGTALAILLARNGHKVHLWGRDSKLMEQIKAESCNTKYLPKHILPNNVCIEPDISVALADSQWIVLTTASYVAQDMIKPIVKFQNTDLQGLIATQKGITPGEGLFMPEMFSKHLPAHIPSLFLSGPSFAAEVARGLPTAVTIAATQLEVAEEAGQLFRNNMFRVYISSDTIGVGIVGALKNVIAIATGVSDGLAYGSNARAALITRGLSEIRRLAEKLGGNPLTVSGLAGLGDLVLTATDTQSRNHRYGMLLAQGQSSEQAKASIGQVVEGDTTARNICARAATLGVEMPICKGIEQIITGRSEVRKVVDGLLQRETKEED